MDPSRLPTPAQVRPERSSAQFIVANIRGSDAEPPSLHEILDPSTHCTL